MHKKEAVKLKNCLLDYFDNACKKVSSIHVEEMFVYNFSFPKVKIMLDCFPFGKGEYYVAVHFSPLDLNVPMYHYTYRTLEAFNYDVFIDDMNFFHLPWVSRIGLLGDLVK